jgi:tRNA pseudouridine38-40 synthase
VRGAASSGAGEGAAAAGVTVLTVAYDGAAFHGFARQPGLETVQGRLEEALGVILHREVVTVGAGRTDAGVHALGQVASFPAAPGDPGGDALRRSLTALVAPYLAVREVRRAPLGFSARHDAVSREYRYLLVPGPVPPVALRGRAWWTKGTLDVGAMRDGAAHLLGEHDFRSFCVTSSAEGKRTVRNVALLEIAPSCELGEECVEIRIAGRSFLHSMVRIIAGSLTQVGKGRRDPAWIADALAARDRSAAGITAPPHGLTLWRVDYPEGRCVGRE